MKIHRNSSDSLAERESLKKFRSKLKEAGLKLTQGRMEIYREILKTRGHFDADELYERFRRKGSPIARDTVYRTIPFLLESGMIQKSAGLKHRDYFENIKTLGHHDHLICVRCGRIVEFKSKQVERWQNEICKKYGFKPVFHDHRLFGKCAPCERKEGAAAKKGKV